MKFATPTEAEIARFMAKTERTETGCLEWQGYRGPKGYGEFAFRGRMRRVHQLAIEWFGGVEIPEGMMVCHSCDNPSCCNHEHLFIGDNAANMADRDAKGRVRHGMAHRNTRVTDEQITTMFGLEKEGLTREEIARRIGCSAQLAGGILNGRYRRSHPLVAAVPTKGPLIRFYSAEERALIKQRAAEGKRAAEIAAEIGRPKRHVFKLLG
jgi:hypothetical protein